MTYQIKIGCDPEAFVKKNGAYVSAHGLIPGSKGAPHTVEGGAVQVDGMAVEFNINPASSYEEFLGNIRGVMRQLEEMLVGYDLFTDPVAHFDPEYMASQPEEALELGCEPDYNAYTGEANPRPDGEVSFRTAGGHVHIGWGEDLPTDHPDHLEACQMFCKELDFYLGVPSLFWDKDDERRTMYGAAGAFRPKSYGVEYRSLSNAWLKDDIYVKLVYEQVRRAFNNLREGRSFYNTYGWLARTIMKGNNRNLARIFLEHERDLLPEGFYFDDGGFLRGRE